MRCPCGLGPLYGACCGRFHQGGSAPTAETLMRSRYSAFALGETTYLLRSWHSSTRPRSITLDPAQEWTGLVVLGLSGGGLLETEGTVEFRALSVHRGRTDVLHELSRFVREDGQWVYLTALPS